MVVATFAVGKFGPMVSRGFTSRSPGAYMPDVMARHRTMGRDRAGPTAGRRR